MAATTSSRLQAKARKLARENERLEVVLKHSWLLGDELIENIKPGDEERLAQLLDRPFDNPLARKGREDVENPARHLLRVLRRPDYFPFLCQHIFNITILPLQHVILKELWHRAFPMLIGSRGMGKSFILGLYAMLKALLHQGTKIVIVGAAFRQAKVVFEYVEMIWANAPVLRDLCGGGKGRNNRDQGPRRDIDRCECIIGDSIIIALPLGDGKKIRGQRGNVIIAEEFASVPPDIYETVVKGFGAVTLDPIGNVQSQARIRVLKKLGRWTEAMEQASRLAVRGNQSIISGTAYYSFNHFAKYHERYKRIVESRGDPHKLAELDPEGKVDPDLDWRDYSIIRIPNGLLPAGLMDQKTIASSRAMSNSSIHLMEYGAVFASDSDGFFRRSLVEGCVARPDNQEVGFTFNASLRGAPGITHIIGVDPASESDNLAIVVLAVYPDHRRVVYCWTTRKKDFQKRQKIGLTREQTFFAFVARKIRELTRAFATERLVMDSQGGGYQIEEALHDQDKLQPGELPIWQVIDPDPKNWKETDNKKGLHILELVQFANAQWVAEANNGLKKDMEDRVLVFPYMDPALLGIAIEEDKKLNRLYDTLEDATMEVEGIKDELSTIVHTQTPTGRDRWDVPRLKGEQDKRGRLRKDRYSALLMSNMAARQLARGPRETTVEAVGGWAGDIVARRNQADGKALYVLGEGWGEMDYPVYGKAVRRGGE